MLDFGFSEIVLTSAIALIVLGPEKLPKVARQVGNWMGRARAMARQLSDQLEREVNAEDLLRQTRKTSSAAPAGAMHTGPVHTGEVSSEPVAFDTSHMPPAGTAPRDAPSAASAAFSPQTASPPHGADWHPSPPEHPTSDV
jgi:sec-independent protein translocase protein TatB